MSHIRAIASHGALALLEAGIIALLVGTLVVAPALAARGGNGDGKGGGRSEATLSVDPNPVPAYGFEYAVTGSGFKPDTAVNVVVSMPTCCAFFTVTADAAGDVFFIYRSGAPGTYQIDANQRLNGKKLTLMARTTFAVVAP